MTSGLRNIKPISKHSFRNFLKRRKGIFIVLLVMGFGALLIGQTVPHNFFKKLFSPEKVSVVKDSVEGKHNSIRNPVVKKPVVVDEEKIIDQRTSTETTIWATCTSAGSGLWSNPLTWSCGVIPGPGDDVIIAVGTTVYKERN